MKGSPFGHSGPRAGKTVTVCDQQAEVGGALRLASKPPGRSELMDILNYFVEELVRLKVDVRYYLRERLKRGGVKLYKNVHVHSFLGDGVLFRAGDQTMELRGFESLVLADTFVSLREAANLIKPHRARIHFIGDARQPRHLMYAISEGEELGRTL